MGVWEWLGIPPSTDIAKIKSAYARQAKLYHPEEHPEEFKALQNAYKMAIRMAKNQVVETSVEPVDISEKNVKAEENPKSVIEHSYDYSSIDSYGDKEQFFRQFLLIAKNPYLCNNLDAWDYFLNRKEFIELFANTDFRMNFVRTVCNCSGWRRKTILFFEQYLNRFHTEENKPADGIWETELTCFRIKKLPYPRLPAFCTDRFLGKEGAAFHKRLQIQISRAQGRELSLEIKSDLLKYMKLYLFYGMSQENNIERLHKEWLSRKFTLNGIAFAACFLIIVSSIYSMKRINDSDNRVSYLIELYGLEADSCSDEEKEELLKNYDSHWKYAKEAINEVLNRHESW